MSCSPARTLGETHCYGIAGGHRPENESYLSAPQTQPRTEDGQARANRQKPRTSTFRRRKGKRTKGQAVPLTSGGLDALRRFDELDCWGSFSTSSAWKSFQRACERIGLSGLRPYDLRHSFGSAVYAASGDLGATQHLLGHASRTTTDRYTLAAVPDRLRIAVGQAEKLQNLAVPRGSTRPVLVNSRK